uniref:Uncharacterized protein n=1 Tax=Ananas comosus var. bracteatus TaxID=296719 RepID=A0A6V7QI45_ANACO|nr:unnamed protein product [Ananas comosus var. bracteatus]
MRMEGYYKQYFRDELNLQFYDLKDQNDIIRDIRILFGYPPEGFYSISEALDIARNHLGPNFFISPNIRSSPQIQTSSSTYNIERNSFCDNCSTMITQFQKLNTICDELNPQAQVLYLYLLLYPSSKVSSYNISTTKLDLSSYYKHRYAFSKLTNPVVHPSTSIKPIPISSAPQKFLPRRHPQPITKQKPNYCIRTTEPLQNHYQILV